MRLKLKIFRQQIVYLILHKYFQLIILKYGNLDFRKKEKGASRDKKARVATKGRESRQKRATQKKVATRKTARQKG